MLFSIRCYRFKSLVLGKSLCPYSAYFGNVAFSGKNTTAKVSASTSKCQFKNLLHYEYFSFSRQQKLYYSKSVLSEIYEGFSNNSQNNDTRKINELFPQPRVTLNEFSAKKSDKIFDIIYKQQNIAPKGSKKSKLTQNDWTCIYAFVWPEKMKFESSAKSKKQAAEKAATLALQWLYKNRKINEKGLPLYERDKLEVIRETLNDPISVAVSEKSMERITRLMDDYQNGIRDIFESTHNNQTERNLAQSCAVKKDSTIEEENDISDGETEDILEPTDLSEQQKAIDPVYGRHIIQPSEISLERRNDKLKRKFEIYYDEITSLPIDEYRNHIITALESSRALVLVGAAGCGKSTRAPAFILGACQSRAKILVSEPRRVAAIGLASRVASELGEDVGESVGYQVRLHSKPPRPPGGSILYCTSGVLLRRLQLNPGLEGCSHVFIDEAHERDVNTDITLLLLKRALQMNPELKVIVMSATLDTGVFTSYFQNCPVLEVPGRTFPVSVTHLEDLPDVFKYINVSETLKNCRQEGSKPQIYYQEVVDLIKAVDAQQPEGAILVFLPGWAEIKNVKKLLDAEFGHCDTHLILPVHSRLSTTDQVKMFSRPLIGIRKIVLSTNIAETSITIPDVVYVIDTGAHKENRITEKTGIASLETVWVSQAAAKQRTGRAGRVQPGICYRMYTKDKESEFVPHTTAEILRIPLEQTVLDCKSYAPDDKVEDFLSHLPEPPSERAIVLAINDLVDLGALSMPEQNLTALGRLLLSFTLPPRLGCALLYSAVIGNVVGMSNVVTQLATNVEVFQNPADRREEIRDIKRKYSETSDHVALHRLQEEYEDIRQNEGWKTVDNLCAKYGIRKERLKFVSDLSRLHMEQLLKSGIVENDPDVDELNRFSIINELNKATLLAACNSLLIAKRTLKTKGKMAIVKSVFTSTGDKAHIGSESVNHSLQKRRPGPKPDILAYFGGYHCSERRAIVLYKTSLITPISVLLFSKGKVTVEKSVDSDNNASLVTIPKHKLQMMVMTSQIDHLMNLRDMIWNTFQYYTERDIKETEVNTEVSRFKIRMLKAVAGMLMKAEKEHLQETKYLEDKYQRIIDDDE